MGIRENHLKALFYHDPATVLRKLRALERLVAAADVDPLVRRLRTQELKKYREWRDAAILTYGLGLAQGVHMGYATEEGSDYDFVAGWLDGGVAHFCPVQLKELVPEDLNPSASLAALLAGLGKYGPRTDTVLAVKLNRKSGLELVDLPPIPFKQLWFFWASASDGARWCLYGDALGEPGYFSFDHPDDPADATDQLAR